MEGWVMIGVDMMVLVVLVVLVVLAVLVVDDL